jgi:hypothetical protein
MIFEWQNSWKKVTILQNHFRFIRTATVCCLPSDPLHDNLSRVYLFTEAVNKLILLSENLIQ